MDETLFFLHLPRTAGTTLNAVLHDNFAPETVLSVYAKRITSAAACWRRTCWSASASSRGI